jgi:hypothetical protein
MARPAWTANAALLVGSTLLGLGALEAVARVGRMAEPSLLVLDPVIGKRFRPDYRGRVFVPEAGREIELRFNREGLRGPDWSLAKPPGTRRVAVLGDSMIASIATDETNTAVRLLETRLNDEHREGAAWEVLNFGVSSSSTGNELVLYRKVAARYAPDVVLCAFFVGNDLADNSFRLTQAPRLYFELDAQGALRQRPFTAAPGAQSASLGGWLDRHSRLYAWQKAALRDMKGRLRSSVRRPEPAHWIFAENEPPDVADAWRLTGRLLAAFREEVQASGGRFAVLVVPSAEQVYDDLWAALRTQAGADADTARFRRDHPQQRLAALCEAAGIPIVTMIDDFRAAAPHADSRLDSEWLFHLGRWHLNDAGQRLAAGAAYRAIAAAR